MLPFLIAGAGALIGGAAILTPLREQLDPRDLAAGVGGHYIRVSGYELWYSDEGPRAAPALVLLHGFASWSFTWRTQRQALLDAGYRVIIFDMIGNGASERVAAPAYSTHSHAEMILAALIQLGIEQVTLIGHSFGARVAFQMALLAPERIERIVAIAPEAFATERPPIAAVVGAPLIGYSLSFFATAPSLVRTGLQLAIRREEWLTDQVLAGYAKPLYVRNSALSQVWQARSPKDGNRPVPHHLGEIHCPVLLIWGAEDPFFPAEHGQRLERIMPNATLKLIDGVGHLPHEEDADATTTQLLTFLTQNCNTNVP